MNGNKECSESGALLEVAKLKKYFPADSKLFSIGKDKAFVKAVDDISFTVKRGDVFGVVGESGCGKTTVLKMLLKMLEPTDGTMLFCGKNICAMNKQETKIFRSRVATVMQDPFGSLSPRMQVKDIIAEPLQIHRKGISKKEVQERVDEVLSFVKMDPSMGSNYPHEFSGGQRQRIAIARALSLKPDLVLLDEPVSALDVSVQAQLMNELMDIRESMHVTYVVVAHNLAVIRFMCNRMMVLYLGKIMEYGDCEEIFEKRLHPYTKALFNAALSPDPYVRREKSAISGDLPSPINLPAGCRFHTRCPYAKDRCAKEEPQLEYCGEDHLIVCHHWRDIQSDELKTDKEGSLV